MHTRGVRAYVASMHSRQYPSTLSIMDQRGVAKPRNPPPHSPHKSNPTTAVQYNIPVPEYESYIIYHVGRPVAPPHAVGGPAGRGLSRSGLGGHRRPAPKRRRRQREEEAHQARRRREGLRGGGAGGAGAGLPVRRADPRGRQGPPGPSAAAASGRRRGRAAAAAAAAAAGVPPGRGRRGGFGLRPAVGRGRGRRRPAGRPSGRLRRRADGLRGLLRRFPPLLRRRPGGGRRRGRGRGEAVAPLGGSRRPFPRRPARRQQWGGRPIPRLRPLPRRGRGRGPPPGPAGRRSRGIPGHLRRRRRGDDGGGRGGGRGTWNACRGPLGRGLRRQRRGRGRGGEDHLGVLVAPTQRETLGGVRARACRREAGGRRRPLRPQVDDGRGRQVVLARQADRPRRPVGGGGGGGPQRGQG